MTAIWMVYALVAGAVVCTLAWLLEQLARSFGWATRGIWIGAIGAMLAVGLVAANPAVVAVRRDTGARRAGDAEAVSAARAAAIGAAPAHLILIPDPRADASGDLRERWARIATAFDARVALEAGLTAPWNGTLLICWALVSAFLAGVRRKAILLPRWALTLEPALLRLVVRHEREHLEAGDPAVLLVALLAVVLVPWQLPLWRAWRRLSLAVEVDCDARVLRTDPDVRRYGQLLLLASQRAVRTPWASAPVFAVVAPLRPHSSRVAHRILVMTQRGAPGAGGRAVLFALGSVLAAATAFSLPAPRPRQPSRAIVHLTSVGLADTSVVPTETTHDELRGEILLYGDGPVRVATGIDTLVPLADTLHLKRLPAITADVTDGELHIVLIGPGSFSVGGSVTGGEAPGSYFGASGRHIALMKGGIGIRGVK